MKPFLLLLLFLCTMPNHAQNAILPIWSDQIPNSQKTDETEEIVIKDILVISKVQQPQIEAYLPTKKNATGQAVLIFPGGGYHVLAYDWEGTDFAKFLNSKGIAGIVVKYRLPNSRSVTEKHNVPLQDAQRAMRLVRSKAKEWNIS